jgi:hypothetical protein
MAKRKRTEPSASDDCSGRLLTTGELKRLMTALGAAGAVLLEAANLIEEVVSSGGAGAIQRLQLLQGAWRLGFRADALSDDVLDVLPEVAERLEADERLSSEGPLQSRLPTIN